MCYNRGQPQGAVMKSKMNKRFVQKAILVFAVILATAVYLFWPESPERVRYHYYLTVQGGENLGFEATVNDVVIHPADFYWSRGQQGKYLMNSYLIPGPNTLRFVVWIPDANKLDADSTKLTFSVEAIPNKEAILEGENPKPESYETWSISLADFLKIAEQRVIEDEELPAEEVDQIVMYKKNNPDSKRFLNVRTIRFVPGHGLASYFFYDIPDDFPENKIIDSDIMFQPELFLKSLKEAYKEAHSVLEKRDLARWKAMTSERDSEWPKLIHGAKDDVYDAKLDFEKEVFAQDSKWQLVEPDFESAQIRVRARGRVASLIDDKRYPVFKFKHSDNDEQVEYMYLLWRLESGKWTIVR